MCRATARQQPVLKYSVRVRSTGLRCPRPRQVFCHLCSRVSPLVLHFSDLQYRWKCSPIVNQKLPIYKGVLRNTKWQQIFLMIGCKITWTDPLYWRKENGFCRRVFLKPLHYDKEVIFSNCRMLKGSVMGIKCDYADETLNKIAMEYCLWRKLYIGKATLFHDPLKIESCMYKWDAARKTVQAPMGNSRTIVTYSEKKK